MKKTILLCSLVLFLQGALFSEAKANDFKNFLLSSVYGTGVGAGVGLLSLAFADEPGDKIHRVYRGASLGLYAGILYGTYLVQTQSTPLWITVKSHNNQVEGALAHFQVSF